MDLSAIKETDRTIEMEHPGTGELIGVRVSIMSVTDDRMSKLKRRIQDEALKLQQKNKHFSAEEIEENRYRIARAAMTGWQWYNPTGKEGDEGYRAEAQADWRGETDPEMNERIVKDVFRTIPWFHERIMTEIGETESFFTASKQI